VRKLVLMMGVSLDGLVARPGKFGAGGWGLPPEDPALKARKLDWIREADLHLMGRNTYEEMAGWWQGPGVAWPKSRCLGCEPATRAVESFPCCPPGLLISAGWSPRGGRLPGAGRRRRR
jgi:hypothetical protein